MKRLGTILVFTLIFTLPAVAQRGGRGGSMRRSYSSAHSAAPSARPAAGKQSASDILSRNTKLASKIQGLTGMPAQQACDGFKNLGQCVAAAHVSQNIPNILFDDLKARMTGNGTDSLGQAIHYVDPTVDANAQAAKATKQANKDLAGS